MATISASVRSFCMILLAGTALTACATQQPRYPSRMSASDGALTPPATAIPGRGIYKVGEPYQVAGIWYVPKEQPDYDQTGMASWYGDEFNMKPTANGEIFDMTALSAAHPTLPLPSMVEVTNLDTGKTLRVRVNDRGPFVGGRVIDLSRAAAQALGYDRQGLAHVRVRYVGPASLNGMGGGQQTASNSSGLVDPPEIASSWAPPVQQMSSPVAVASSALPPAAAVSRLGEPVQAGLYRVQAGAFSDPQNARRVASNLSQAGEAVIEPVEREGITFYRVMLSSGGDEGEAFALRDRVAELGYAEARVLRPF